MSSQGKNIDLVQNIEEKYCGLIQMAKAKNHKKIVVDAGLLKAGKSSLCNALVGKNVFVTDVVRATVENAQIEMDDYILLDTPGLDARDEDTNIALMGYEMADVILFVHNLQEGELSQTEVDSIKQIADIFGDWDMFFKNVILILTHKDQVEDHFEAIRKQIDEQCKKVLNNQFAKTFCVDSIGYMKGLQENKTLLMQDSGILELQKAVTHYINDEYDLQYFRFEKKKKECIKEITQAIATIRTEMPTEEPNRTTKLRQAKEEMKKIAEDAVNKVSSYELWFSTASKGDFSCCAGSRRGRRYSSESSARSAGVDVVDNMLKRANERMEVKARHIIEEAEGYVEMSGTATGMKNIFSDAYEKMREITKDKNILLKTTFSIVLKNFVTSSIKYDLDLLRTSAKHIAGYSGSTYSSYIDIDYDYVTKYVQGLFGQKEKQVKEYEFDASDAVQEADYDMCKSVNELSAKAKKIVAPVFVKIKEDLCKQFNSLLDVMFKEIDDAIKQEEEKQRSINEITKQLNNSISKLENRKREIEAL